MQIVFLDDCSSDTSLDVAAALLGRGGNQFRIIRNDKNQGVYRQSLEGCRRRRATSSGSPRRMTIVRPVARNPRAVIREPERSPRLLPIEADGRDRAQIAPDYLGWTADVDDAKWRQR